MNLYVEAIYENGVLRPLKPLALTDRQQVTVLIRESAGDRDRSFQDTSYASELKEELQACGNVPSIEEILKLTSKDTSSWRDAVIQAREERS